MAITHDHLRIVPSDGDGTGPNDRLRIEALPDQSLGLSATDRTRPNVLLRSLLAIQNEGTLLGRLQRVVDAAVDVLQRTDVAVAVPDETRSTLEVASAAGRLKVARGRRVSVLDELIGAVVRCGESRLLGDVRLDPRVDVTTFSTLGETRSWLGVPLVGPTGPFGALVATDTTPHAFDADDEQALNALACLTSAALDEVRCLELNHRRRDHGDERDLYPHEIAEVPT